MNQHHASLQRNIWDRVWVTLYIVDFLVTEDKRELYELLFYTFLGRQREILSYLTWEMQRVCARERTLCVSGFWFARLSLAMDEALPGIDGEGTSQDRTGWCFRNSDLYRFSRVMRRT